MEANPNQRQINKQLASIAKLDDERRIKYYDWLKNLVSISVIFLGLIISLKGDGCAGEIKHIFFIISLATMSLGILFGLIVLYSEVDIPSALRSNILGHTKQLMDGIETTPLPPPVNRKIYDIFSFCCYFFYTSSLVLFVVYSAIKS